MSLKCFSCVAKTVAKSKGHYEQGPECLDKNYPRDSGKWKTSVF